MALGGGREILPATFRDYVKWHLDKSAKKANHNEANLHFPFRARDVPKPREQH